jgi:molybdopterin-guanine dinucleotide biosynthesis protein A
MGFTRHDNITGVLLVGGKSRRMGQDKAFLKLDGRPLFEPVIDLFSSRFNRLLLAGDQAERFTAYGIPVVPDIYPGSSLGGIHAGLQAAETERIFVAPCDLPFPSAALLDHICRLADNNDVVVPISSQGYEPLYALYSKVCLKPMQDLLEKNIFKIIELFQMVKTCFIQGEELAALIETEKAFLNINTPTEFQNLSGIPSTKAGDR